MAPSILLLSNTTPRSRPSHWPPARDRASTTSASKWRISINTRRSSPDSVVRSSAIPVSCRSNSARRAAPSRKSCPARDTKSPPRSEDVAQKQTGSRTPGLKRWQRVSGAATEWPPSNRLRHRLEALLRRRFLRRRLDQKKDEKTNLSDRAGAVYRHYLDRSFFAGALLLMEMGHASDVGGSL